MDSLALATVITIHNHFLSVTVLKLSVNMHLLVKQPLMNSLETHKHTHSFRVCSHAANDFVSLVIVSPFKVYVPNDCILYDYLGKAVI